MEGDDAPDLLVVSLVSGDRRLVLGPVATERVDLRLVDDLMRLHLAGRRFGWSVQLTGADGDLADLLAFVGLGTVTAP